MNPEGPYSLSSRSRWSRRPFPTVAEAKKKGPKITVMTRNLFLGADLRPRSARRRIAEAIDGAGEIWNEMQSTKFPERAKPLAREIKRSKADLVGLQEVALWRKQTPSDVGAPPISPIGGRPRRRSSRTSSRSSSASSRRSAPATRSSSCRASSRPSCPSTGPLDATGTGPLPLRRRLRRPADDARRDPRPPREQGEARQDAHGPLHDPVRAQRRRPRHPGRPRLGLGRGEARQGKKFRFVDTHLEAFGDPKIREAQAVELTKGPLKTKHQVILVGDLNSGIARHNEPEQPGDDLAFNALAGFG